MSCYSVRFRGSPSIALLVLSSRKQCFSPPASLLSSSSSFSTCLWVRLRARLRSDRRARLVVRRTRGRVGRAPIPVPVRVVGLFQPLRTLQWFTHSSMWARVHCRISRKFRKPRRMPSPMDSIFVTGRISNTTQLVCPGCGHEHPLLPISPHLNFAGGFSKLPRQLWALRPPLPQRVLSVTRARGILSYILTWSLGHLPPHLAFFNIRVLWPCAESRRMPHLVLRSAVLESKAARRWISPCVRASGAVRKGLHRPPGAC